MKSEDTFLGRPCPRCGFNGQVYLLHSGFTHLYRACCGAFWCHESTPSVNSREEAIAVWNAVAAMSGPGQPQFI